jgi:hypothetical protein
MRRLTHLIVLVAFVFSCGGQWAAFQCIAWANMIHDYSQVVPLEQAVRMTFSGQYPCEICKAITEKKSSDEQKSLALDKYQKKFFPPLAIDAIAPDFIAFTYAEYSKLLFFRVETPPAPPPRLVLS